jgi:hypothetical protein
MVNNEEVTAKWAKVTSQKILGIKIEKELADCLQAIKNSVSRNESSVNIDIYANQLTKIELEKRGFKVTQHSDQREGSYLNINWE